MRYVVLALAASSLALAGCGKKEATGNTSALDESVSAEDFVTNDATAIDAATGADANMAADIDINALENTSDGDGPAARSESGKRASSHPAAPASNASDEEPAAEPLQPATPPAESNAG